MNMNFNEYRSQLETGVSHEVAQAFERDLDAMGLEVNVVSADNPVSGEVGMMIWGVRQAGRIRRHPIENEDPDNFEEVTVYVRHQVAQPAVQVEHNSVEDFEAAFADAYEKDYPIQLYDDPNKLFVGFVIERRSGREWHCLGLSYLYNEEVTNAK
jgi:hypothetical protein